MQIAALAAAFAFVVGLFVPRDDDGGGTSQPDGAASGEVDGAAVFTASCAGCHGRDGQGGIGPQLAGEVVDRFPDIEDQIAVVTDGRGGMPSFDGRLSPEEIEAVVTYTREELGT